MVATDSRVLPYLIEQWQQSVSTFLISYPRPMANEQWDVTDQKSRETVIISPTQLNALNSHTHVDVHLKQKLRLKLKTELKKINCNKRGENLWHQKQEPEHEEGQEQELKKILERPKLMKCRNGIIKLLIALCVRPSVCGSVLTRLVCS